MPSHSRVSLGVGTKNHDPWIAAGWHVLKDLRQGIGQSVTSRLRKRLC